MTLQVRLCCSSEHENGVKNLNFSSSVACLDAVGVSLSDFANLIYLGETTTTTTDTHA